MLYPPRTYYQYSNLGLTLAGEIVAAASGRAYDDYIRANILDPLGMSSTFTDLQDRFRGNPAGERVHGARAGRHTPTDSGLPGARHQPRGRVRLDGGGPGALRLVAVSACSRETTRCSTGTRCARCTACTGSSPTATPPTGWASRCGSPTATPSVGHGGSCPGYRSHLLLRPQDKVATAFMTNGQGVNSRRFAQTAYDIVAPALRKAAGKQDGDAPAEEIPAGVEGGAAAVDDETLMRFTGTYQRPLGGESAVLVREGDLHVLPLPHRRSAGLADPPPPHRGRHLPAGARQRRSRRGVHLRRDARRTDADVAQRQLQHTDGRNVSRSSDTSGPAGLRKPRLPRISEQFGQPRAAAEAASTESQIGMTVCRSVSRKSSIGSGARLHKTKRPFCSRHRSGASKYDAKTTNAHVAELLAVEDHASDVALEYSIHSLGEGAGRVSVQAPLQQDDEDARIPPDAMIEIRT